MGFREHFKDSLKKQIEKVGSQDVVQIKSGVKQSTLSEFYTGKTKNPRLDLIAGIMDALDDEIFIELVKQLRPHISWAEAKPGYREVRTYNIIGAKHLSDLTEERRQFTLRIPEKYFPSDFAVLFSGNSMSSIIPDHAAAGVTKEFDFRPGEIYLCELPVEGLTFKRVILFPSQGLLEFRAEPKEDKDMLQPHTYSVEEGEKYIVGKLMWVASRK